MENKEWIDADSFAPGEVDDRARIDKEVVFGRRPHECSTEERIQKAKDFKAKGADSFKAGKWSAARLGFTTALDFVSDAVILQPNTQEALELHIACLLNAAQCSLKLEEWYETKTHCSRALRLKKLSVAQKVKAYFRRGVAHAKMAEFVEARAWTCAA